MLSGNGNENPLRNWLQNPTSPKTTTHALKNFPVSSTAVFSRYPRRVKYDSVPLAKSCAPREDEWNALMVICSDHASVTPASLHPCFTVGPTHFL